MARKFLLVLVLMCAGKICSQETISGQYFVGDKKASIHADEMSYYLVYEEDKMVTRLQYEENTPENEQIWLVWYKGKQAGTIIFKSDYKTGTYTDYRTGQESLVKKKP
jgi:hypothetical protein